MHAVLAADGRVAMLACLGWLVAELVHLPDKQFSNPVALDAIYQVPVAGWIQILVAISVVELATFKMVYDPKRAAGQFGFDPLKLDSPTMRLKEVKNGRLAMIGISTFCFVGSCLASKECSPEFSPWLLWPGVPVVFSLSLLMLTDSLSSVSAVPLSPAFFARVNSTVGLIFQQLVFHKPTISQLTNGVTL